MAGCACICLLCSVIRYDISSLDSIQNDMLNLQLPVRLTRDEVVGWVRDIEPLLKQAKASGETVAVDASALKQFDSSALAALLAVHRETQSLGVAFAGVQGMSVTLQSLAQVYGIDELLPQVPEPEQ